MKFRNYFILPFLFSMIIVNAQNTNGYIINVENPQNVSYLTVYEDEILDERIKNFSSLTSIYFIAPKGEKLIIPEEFESLTKIRSISIEGGEIEEIPDLLFSSKEISSIGIHCPKLINIPNSIFDLPNLRSLDISRTPKIQFLPDDIGKMQSLTVLNLGFTKITSLPNSITDLINLSELEYGNITHAAIPNEINKLINLRSIFIRGKLESIPDNFYKLNKLKNLTFFGTGIKLDTAKICELESLESYYNSERFLPDEINTIKKCNAKLRFH